MWTWRRGSVTYMWTWVQGKPFSAYTRTVTELKLRHFSWVSVCVCVGGGRKRDKENKLAHNKLPLRKNVSRVNNLWSRSKTCEGAFDHVSQRIEIVSWIHLKSDTAGVICDQMCKRTNDKVKITHVRTKISMKRNKYCLGNVCNVRKSVWTVE